MAKRFYVVILLMALAVIVMIAAEPALAQCAMCKQAVSGSEEAQTVSKGINLAILVLLLPPVAIFLGIFGAFYRSRNERDQDQIG